MRSNKPTVHIIGAGISGLSVGYLLSKTNKFDITIFEKEPHVGGMIKSQKHDEFLVESAANSILCNQQTLSLLNELLVQHVRPLSTAKNRFFFRDHLRRWPLNFLETVILIPRIMFHLVTNKKFLQLEGTVSDWAKKYFGFSFAQYFLSPALQGIYALPADKLDAKLILTPLFKKKSRKYQGIVSGLNGMEDIIQALKNKCIQNQAKLFTEINYDFNQNADAVILCTSAADAAKVLKSKDSQLSQDLEKIHMNPVLSVTCQVPARSTRPPGFGCLIPRDQNLKCLGVLFNSDIFENRASENEISETYIFSDQEAVQLSQLNDVDLEQEIINMRKKLFSTEDSIKIYKNYWPQGLPVYNEALLNFQKQLSLPKNIYLHGNYTNGIGLSKIIEGSYELSEKLIRELK